MIVLTKFLDTYNLHLPFMEHSTYERISFVIVEVWIVSKENSFFFHISIYIVDSTAVLHGNNFCWNKLARLTI